MALVAALPSGRGGEVLHGPNLLAIQPNSVKDLHVIEPKVLLPALAFEAVIHVVPVDIDDDSGRFIGLHSSHGIGAKRNVGPRKALRIL